MEKGVESTRTKETPPLMKRYKRIKRAILTVDEVLLQKTTQKKWTTNDKRKRKKEETKNSFETYIMSNNFFHYKKEGAPGVHTLSGSNRRSNRFKRNTGSQLHLSDSELKKGWLPFLRGSVSERRGQRCLCLVKDVDTEQTQDSVVSSPVSWTWAKDDDVCSRDT